MQEVGKALEMFEELDVPVLGTVENMSHTFCECGRRTHPFGCGGGAALAGRAGVSLLGDVPYDAPIVEAQDRRAPSVIEKPAGPVARAFRGIALAMAERIGAEAATPDA